MELTKERSKTYEIDEALIAEMVSSLKVRQTLSIMVRGYL